MIEQPPPRIHGFSWHALPGALGLHKPRTDEVWIRHPWVGPGTGDVTQAWVLAHEMAHYGGGDRGGGRDGMRARRASSIVGSACRRRPVWAGAPLAGRPGMGSGVRAWFPVASWLNAAGVEVIRRGRRGNRGRQRRPCQCTETHLPPASPSLSPSSTPRTHTRS